MRLRLLVVVVVVAAGAAEVRAGRYVVLENVKLHAGPSERSPSVELRRPRPVEFLGTRGTWYVVRTFGHQVSSCKGGRTAVRGRWYVRAHRLKRALSAAERRNYRGCGSFAGRLRQTRRVRESYSFARSRPKAARIWVLRGRAALYWPDGTRAGVNESWQILRKQPRPGRRNRVCAPVTVWYGLAQVAMCFARSAFDLKLTESFGVEGGVPGGVVGGVLGGTTRPPPPPPKRPMIVLQRVLERSRIAGNRRIQPPKSVKLHMKRHGKTRLIAVEKLCLNRRGTVSSLKLLKSSGYRSYDAKLRRVMRKWRYRPLKVNGRPVPVCTSVTFIYHQRR